MGTLGGKQWPRLGGLPACGSRRLAADRRTDAVEVLPDHRAVATGTCRWIRLVRHVSGYFVRFPQIVLQLDVSRGDRLRVSVEARPRHLPAQFSITALG